MSWLSYSALIPPNLFILLTVIGFALAWRWTRLGLIVATVSAILLYLTSTPLVAEYLFGCVPGLADAIPSLPSGAPPRRDYRACERLPARPAVHGGTADP
jgi:hypothetical protein